MKLNWLIVVLTVLSLWLGGYGLEALVIQPELDKTKPIREIQKTKPIFTKEYKLPSKPIYQSLPKEKPEARPNITALPKERPKRADPNIIPLPKEEAKRSLTIPNYQPLEEGR
jgi:hypothetical protein